jgi:hypothetical protein
MNENVGLWFPHTRNYQKSRNIICSWKLIFLKEQNTCIWFSILNLVLLLQQLTFTLTRQYSTQLTCATNISLEPNMLSRRRQEISQFYRTRKFIIIFTRILRWTACWVSPHPLILNYHIVFSFIHQWLCSPLFDPGLFFSSVMFFTQTAGLLGRVISLSQGRYPHTGQYKHIKNAHTDIHALNGIRTQYPSVWAGGRRQFMP